MGKYLVEFGTALVQDPQTNKEPVEYVKRLLALKAKVSSAAAPPVHTCTCCGA
jgi:hypothetical protein